MCKCVLMFTLCLMSNSTVLGQVYNVVPVDLGEGYSIAPGSTMTAVDGEISDWLITVEGEYPFTFRATTDPVDFVWLDNVIVTQDDISITLVGSDAGAGISDIYDGSEGCVAEDICEATIAWNRGFNPVTNEFSQTVSFGHRALTQSTDEVVFNVFTSQPLPLGSTVIAVASKQVPEPNTGLLTAMGLLCLTGLRRKRSQSLQQRKRAMYKCTVILTVCMLSSSSAFGEVYNVVPIDLGDGYSIAPGSTMTTIDGVVTDWSISVEGEYPFKFTSPTEELVILDHLTVTNDEISISLVDWESAAFVYTYYEGCVAEDFCEAILAWSRGFNPVTNEFAQVVSFRHRAVTQANGSDPDGPDPDDYVFNVSTSQPLPFGKTVIAVASQSVPEPAAGCLVAMGLFCVLGLRRKRSR